MNDVIQYSIQEPFSIWKGERKAVLEVPKTLCDDIFGHISRPLVGSSATQKQLESTGGPDCPIEVHSDSSHSQSRDVSDNVPIRPEETMRIDRVIRWCRSNEIRVAGIVGAHTNLVDTTKDRLSDAFAVYVSKKHAKKIAVLFNKVDLQDGRTFCTGDLVNINHSAFDPEATIHYEALGLQAWGRIIAILEVFTCERYDQAALIVKSGSSGAGSTTAQSSVIVEKPLSFEPSDSSPTYPLLEQEIHGGIFITTDNDKFELEHVETQACSSSTPKRQIHRNIQILFHWGIYECDLNEYPEIKKLHRHLPYVEKKARIISNCEQIVSISDLLGTIKTNQAADIQFEFSESAKDRARPVLQRISLKKGASDRTANVDIDSSFYVYMQKVRSVDEVCQEVEEEEEEQFDDAAAMEVEYQEEAEEKEEAENRSEKENRSEDRMVLQSANHIRRLSKRQRVTVEHDDVEEENDEEDDKNAVNDFVVQDSRAAESDNHPLSQESESSALLLLPAARSNVNRSIQDFKEAIFWNPKYLHLSPFWKHYVEDKFHFYQQLSCNNQELRVLNLIAANHWKMEAWVMRAIEGVCCFCQLPRLLTVTVALPQKNEHLAYAGRCCFLKVKKVTTFVTVFEAAREKILRQHQTFCEPDVASLAEYQRSLSPHSWADEFNRFEHTLLRALETSPFLYI